MPTELFDEQHPIAAETLLFLTTPVIVTIIETMLMDVTEEDIELLRIKNDFCNKIENIIGNRCYLFEALFVTKLFLSSKEALKYHGQFVLHAAEKWLHAAYTPVKREIVAPIFPILKQLTI